MVQIGLLMLWTPFNWDNHGNEKRLNSMETAFFDVIYLAINSPLL